MSTTSTKEATAKYTPPEYTARRGDKEWETVVKTATPKIEFTFTKNRKCRVCQGAFVTNELNYDALGTLGVSEKQVVEDTNTATNFNKRYNVNRRNMNICGKDVCQLKGQEATTKFFAVGKAANKNKEGTTAGSTKIKQPSKKNIKEVANAGYAAAVAKAEELHIDGGTHILVHVGAGNAGEDGFYSTATDYVDSMQQIQKLSAAVRKLTHAYSTMSNAGIAAGLNEVRAYFAPSCFRGV